MSRVCTHTCVSFFFKSVCNVVSSRMYVWVYEFYFFHFLTLFSIVFTFSLSTVRFLSLCWSFFFCLVQKLYSTFSYYFFTLFNILSILLHHHHFRGTLSYKLTKNRKLLLATGVFVLEHDGVSVIFFFSNDSTALLRAFVVVSAVKNVVFLCSPEGFDFSHICLYVCVCVVIGCCDRRTHAHTFRARVAAFAWEGFVFFFGEKEVFDIKISYFCDIFQFFLQFDPLVCCECECVGEANNLFVCEFVCCQNTSEKRGSRACIGVKRCASKS